MEYNYTPYILPFVAAGAVLIALLRVAWQNRRNPVAQWFAATLAFMLWWAIGYTFELMSTTKGQMLFWANLQFVGVGAAWICWWETVRRYVGVRALPRALTALIWAIPLVTLLFAFWNPAGLFRGEAQVVMGASPFPVLDPQYGPWHRYVFMPEVAVLNGATLVILLRALTRASSFYRRQYMLLLIALILPLGATIQYVFGLGLWAHYNLTVAVAGLSGILLAIGLFRWRLFNMVPFARGLVVENLADGVIVADSAGCLADLNGAAEAILGLKRKEVVGRPTATVLLHHAALAELLTDGSSEQQPVAEDPARTETTFALDGQIRHFGLTGSPVLWHDGEVLGRAVVVHDITERVRLTEQTRKLADTDDLTRLVNRRRFLEVAAKELERCQRYGHSLSLALFDIDHFKKVNDTYGHRAGDMALVQLASACLRTFRRVDLVGRFGGEEFAVLMPETDLENALPSCERFCRFVEGLDISIGDKSTEPLRLTVSGGVAEFDACLDECRDGLDSLIARADDALYQAKSAGRNTVLAAASITSDISRAGIT